MKEHGLTGPGAGLLAGLRPRLARARGALRRAFSRASRIGSRHSVKKYVFVVTYGRSGSTLLQTLIGGLPGYHMRGENQDALRHLMRSHQSALITKKDFGQKRTPFNGPWYGADEIDAERYGRRLAQLFLDEILTPPRGCRAVGFKEIRYFKEVEELEIYIAFMRRFFAPARFVFNTRDPAAVAESSWWKNMPREDVLGRITTWNEITEDYVARHGEDCLLLRYDAYTADHGELRALFDFLGEPYDATLVDHVFQARLKH